MDNRAIAERLYAALQAKDAAALIELLHPDYTGYVSDGMPCGVGGAIASGEQMLVGVWGKVAQVLDTAPYAEEFLDVGSDRMVVLGHYRGSAIETGRAYEAIFAHDLRFADDRIISLTQITDTQPWHQALQT